jgi:hypothetical protein
MASKRRTRTRIGRQRPARGIFEQLESRYALATDVLTFHNDLSQGLNANEVDLSPANVHVGSFGKYSTTPVDGQVYTQPLVKTGVTISSGPNTAAGAAGLHDVVFIGTEHDQLYAIDSSVAHAGEILWHRDLLDIATPGYSGNTAGTNVNNTLAATAIATVPNGDLGSADINPEVGITGTPVIDPTTGTLYVVAKTKETIKGATHYVQRLHAINISDGTDRVNPLLIGDTTGGNTNNTSIYVYGSGDGSVTDPYNHTGKSVVQFNALREHQRGALSLVNQKIYVPWASHGDNGPYHGWLAVFDVADLAKSGMQLAGVWNATPNSGLSGIWQGGGRPAFEPDGSALYLEMGNGPKSHGNPTLNASGFPSDNDYFDALVKLVPDSTTSPTHQNGNGWGLKIADYFIPFNQTTLDQHDQDFGSGAPLLLPDSAGIPGHPHLMVVGGKQGKLYLIDRDNLGKFNATNDRVVNAVDDGAGHKTPPVQLGGDLSTPAFFNGAIYAVSGYSDTARSFAIKPNGTLAITSQTAAKFGYLPGSPSVSASGNQNGIVWVPDRNANVLHAYDATTLSTELWNSGQKAGGADSVGALVKFAPPTIANGEVFVGTTSSLVIYGLTPPATAVPLSPKLAATAISGSSVNLTWSDSTQPPNVATGYAVEMSTDAGPNKTYKQVATAASRTTALPVGGLTPATTYYFRISGINGLGRSVPSDVVSVTTPKQQAVGLDFSNGFASAGNLLKYNGSAAQKTGKAELTSGQSNQAGSVFMTSPINVSSFQTQFSFQLSSGSATADGFTFTLQNNSPSALGTSGLGLGYASLTKSVAIKFDLYSNSGEGTSSTGLFLAGAKPTNVGSVDLLAKKIDLHSGHKFQVNLSYDGATLTETITDLGTGAIATVSYTVDLVKALGGTQAYVGFTGGTGGKSATQDILNWTFTAAATQPPGAPSGLGAVPAAATSITLNWTNNAVNQSGYYLDRATDPDFLQNLITETLPGTPVQFTDSATGLAPGGTFYYRLRAFNSAGVSDDSNVASASIPVAPPKPDDAEVTFVSDSRIDLSWIDNAGRQADGYHVLRAVDHGTYSIYATLPALNDDPPGEIDWSDTALSPGTYYDYHIQAFNVAGNNDFTGTGATTLPAAATVSASAGNGYVDSHWNAVTGAVTYNVYRGTSAGGEDATPLVPALNVTSFHDTAVVNGVTYYYKVTAVNANDSPLPNEGRASSEVAAKPSPQTVVLNFSNGFANSAGTLKYNGSAAIKNGAAELTSGQANQAGSVFSVNKVNATSFSTQFSFQATAGSTTADGFTFTLQNTAATAMGLSGGNLGYTNIGKSVAIKFDLYNNSGEGSSSTGLFINGVAPKNVNSVNLLSRGIDLHSGHRFQVTLSYDGTTLTETITDSATGATATMTYLVNLLNDLGGNLAYVGFTGGTGGKTATQDILNWTYSTLS